MPIIFVSKAFVYFLFFMIAGVFALEHRPSVLAAACISLVGCAVDFGNEIYLQAPKVTLCARASVRKSLEQRFQIEPYFIGAAAAQVLLVTGMAVLIVYAIDQSHRLFFDDYMYEFPWVTTILVYCLPGLAWLTLQYWSALKEASYRANPSRFIEM